MCWVHHADDGTRYVHGINPYLLNPRDTWHDKVAYDQKARELIRLFNDNVACNTGKKSAL